jgi:hypothetical protein
MDIITQNARHRQRMFFKTRRNKNRNTLQNKPKDCLQVEKSV